MNFIKVKQTLAVKKQKLNNEIEGTFPILVNIRLKKIWHFSTNWLTNIGGKN